MRPALAEDLINKAAIAVSEGVRLVSFVLNEIFTIEELIDGRSALIGQTFAQLRIFRIADFVRHRFGSTQAGHILGDLPGKGPIPSTVEGVLVRAIHYPVPIRILGDDVIHPFLHTRPHVLQEGIVRGHPVLAVHTQNPAELTVFGHEATAHVDAVANASDIAEADTEVSNIACISFERGEQP